MIIEIPDDVFLKLEQGLFKRARNKGEDPAEIGVGEEIKAIFVRALEKLEGEVGSIEVEA